MQHPDKWTVAELLFLFFPHERQHSCINCFELLTGFITNFIYMFIENEFTVNYNVRVFHWRFFLFYINNSDTFSLNVV